MLLAMSVFGWLAWTSHSEPGVGHVAGGKPVNTEANVIPDERYEFLAAFEAPEYVPVRGAPESFQTAMALYKKQSYSGAASALREVADAQPDLTSARFYLGISLLLSGDRIGGIQELRSLTDGAGSYRERARFYLAKGLLAEHDSKRAQEELQRVIEQRGELEKQATALLEQIRTS